MDAEQLTRGEATLHAARIGGIDETSVTFSPGVTILEGRNATNRTSFLRAIAAACGSDMASLKGDAEEGRVELSLGSETYSRRLARRDGTIRSSGDPYLDDPTLADLFAFLLESNEARRAVARGDDLRDLIMRPIDTEEIQSEIDRLLEKRTRLDEQLDEIESLKGDLPALEAERTRLQEDIAEKKEELAQKERELAEADTDLEASREAKSELETALEELREKRAELDDVRYDIETEQERLDALRKERNELEDERADLPDAPAGEISDLDAEIERLRAQKQSLESEVNELQSVIGFNEEMLDGSGTVVDELHDEEGELTDQLLADDGVTCWTCGSDVEESQIQATVDELRELTSSKFEEISTLEDRIDDLRDERRTLEAKQQQRERAERRLDTLERDIEDQQSTIDGLKTRRDRLREEIESQQETVDALEADTHREVVELNKEANQLEYELGRLESELERVQGEITDIEARLAEEDALVAEREDLQERLADLRTKIDRVEREAVKSFNTHMETVLDLLDYDNLDRIWLEGVETEGGRTNTTRTFTLHVVRSTASGTTYEDTVDHLSESEREVTGLVFALAGYLVHEVYESVPFMLLDSLEAIDSSRIATLVDYLSEHSRYLVVALLPEDAAALDEEYQRVTSI